MRSRVLFSAVLLVALFLGPSFVAAPDEEGEAPSRSATASSSTNGIAVVELFTSEGCSSCPPADRLLRALVDEARSGDRPVYALSFHVDYWNNLGWEDPYSDSAYTTRQRTYAQALGARVYTPQIIVNGTEVLVGSRETEVRSAIQSALSERASVAPTIRLLSDTATAPSVRVTTEKPPDHAAIHVALVERGLSQSVARGENAGRTLRHSNVVRSFKTVPAENRQVVSLDAPADLDPAKASVIAYVQHRRSMEILGAARVDLSNPSS